MESPPRAKFAQASTIKTPAPQTHPTVCVIGLGYIGLPTAAVIARAGCRVYGVDSNPEVVATIHRGDIHIDEADLAELVRDVVASGSLVVSQSPCPADVFIIAVPTPLAKGRAPNVSPDISTPDISTPDISYVLAATRTLAPVLKAGDMVILESTSPVGTTLAVRDLIASLRPDLACPDPARPGVSGSSGREADLAIAYCPERVLPGRTLVELANNDRAIGGITPACAERAAAFYQGFVKGACLATSANTAELTKLVENAYRDVNIAFANELSIIADHLGIDVWEVIRLANRHPRVSILNPGPGVGGHCIAVDPWFIVAGAPAHTPLIRAARGVNDAKIHHVIARAAALVAAHPDTPVACLGLAFKGNSDDLRESPARLIAATLARRFGERIHVVEPHITRLPREFDGTGARFCDLDAALAMRAMLIVLVDHDVFRAVPLSARADRLVYDTRGIWPDQAAAAPPLALPEPGPKPKLTDLKLAS